MIVVEDMEKKDIVALKEKLKKVNHVEDVIWYDDAMDITVPTEMLPDKLREGLFNGNATMMIALFDNTTSADSTMDAITEMRGIVKKQAFISGMSGVVIDIKNLADGRDADLCCCSSGAFASHFVTDDGFPGNTIYLFAWYRYGDCL